MMSQYLRSAHYIEVDGNCDIGITYDGGGSRTSDILYLYDPTVVDLTDPALAFASNADPTDPKTMTLGLNAAGKWKLVILHNQDMLTLDSYTVSIDTSRSSSCGNPCTVKSNTDGMVPLATGEPLMCYCVSGYYWSPLQT